MCYVAVGSQNARPHLTLRWIGHALMLVTLTFTYIYSQHACVEWFVMLKWVHYLRHNTSLRCLWWCSWRLGTASMHVWKCLSVAWTSLSKCSQVVLFSLCSFELAGREKFVRRGHRVRYVISLCACTLCTVSYYCRLFISLSSLCCVCVCVCASVHCMARDFGIGFNLAFGWP